MQRGSENEEYDSREKEKDSKLTNLKLLSRQKQGSADNM